MRGIEADRLGGQRGGRIGETGVRKTSGQGGGRMGDRLWDRVQERLISSVRKSG